MSYVFDKRSSSDVTAAIPEEKKKRWHPRGNGEMLLEYGLSLLLSLGGTDSILFKEQMVPLDSS
jgi:hypothetical protein